VQVHGQMSKYIGVVKVGFGRRVCPYRCGYGTNCQSGWILSGVFVARSSRSSSVVFVEQRFGLFFN